MTDDFEADQLMLVASEEAEQIQKVSDSLTMVVEEVKTLFERAHEVYQSGEPAAVKGLKESVDELIVKLESDAASLKESYENLSEAVDAAEEEEDEEEPEPKPEPKAEHKKPAPAKK